MGKPPLGEKVGTSLLFVVCGSKVRLFLQDMHEWLISREAPRSLQADPRSTHGEAFTGSLRVQQREAGGGFPSFGGLVMGTPGGGHPDTPPVFGDWFCCFLSPRGLGGGE